MSAQLLNAFLTVLLGVGGCVTYFFGSNWLLDRLFAVNNHSDEKSIRNLARQEIIRPWLFMAPAVILLTIYLLYPVTATVFYAFHDKAGTSFVGLDNFRWAFSDDGFRQSIINNLLWLAVVPAACTGLGLIIAVLTDRLWWGNLAKSLIFLPMAISFVGASVIWKFVYDYRQAGQQQIGILNAVVEWFGGEPQVWISLPFWNNFFLMIILIWIQTGFATVILSAALRGIPEDTIEAAMIDGASPFKIFYRIMVPQISGTILVVWTTITVLVLKVFDIVLTMTNGQWNTNVLANLMFDWMFRGGGDNGRGAAIAIIIMIAVMPIMIYNIFQANAEQRGY